MKLVIVESPTKCQTIKKYLGSDFNVVASYGHIRDLSTSGKGGLGIDVENDFKPTYINSKDKTKIIHDLIKSAKGADEILLATDPDREGEAISWHLAELLHLDPKTTKRMEFHEITKPAVLKALENPRLIDMSLVESQETRRIIDRIMGFKLSTLLKRKIGSLSAGRVQSVVLKLIVEREKEIQAFVASEYWTIQGLFDKKLEAKLEHEVIKSEQEADEILAKLPSIFNVKEVNKRIRKTESKPPFTTSTLQQEAFAKCHFSTKKTAAVAQKLYEGLQIGKEQVGLITYMRTDSTRLSPEFVDKATSFIETKYGKEYVGKVNTKQNKGLVQDAHEAIRPTSLAYEPKAIKEYLTPDQYSLYSLIYKRALASLMSEKVDEVTVAKLEGNGYIFKCEGVVNEFPGYSKLYESSDKVDDSKALPKLEEGQLLEATSITKEQHFTQAPPRYSEAKLVKMMQELGIGRPSTYASTISTLYERKYISQVKGIITPTEQGIETVDKLQQFFSPFMDVTYTANMEESLDDIVAGNNSRLNLLHSFYDTFEEYYQKALVQMDKALPKETGEICPNCGKPLVYKKSKFGEFIACSSYPECKYVKPKEEKKVEYLEGENCPKCGKPLVKRHSKKGDFYACSGYPTCMYIKGQENVEKEEPIVTDKKCPKCGSPLLLRKGKNGKSDFLGCSSFPRCKHIESIQK
ncbi:MAG: type I DNA topoisomerase [Bacilli bacterium]